MKKRVLITNDCPDNARQILEEKYEVIQHMGEPLQKEAFIKMAKDFDGVITSLTDEVNQEVLDQCPKVKVFANCAVGFNNFDLEAAKEKGVYLANTPDVLSDTTAETAWALLMAVSRRIVEADKYLRSGQWQTYSYRTLLGQDVYNKKLGIIGAGRIGHRFAEKARGYHMEIYYHNRNRDYEFEKSFDAQYIDLEEMMATCDIISLHCPLTPQTHQMINKEKIALMKKESILINTARGGVVDYEALIEALEENRIFGAGLDVFPEEPYVDPRLCHLENVVLLPHIGSASTATREKMAEMAAKNVMAVLEGKPPFNPVG